MSLLGMYPTDTLAHVLNERTLLFIAALMRLGKTGNSPTIHKQAKLIMLHMCNAILGGCKTIAKKFCRTDPVGTEYYRKFLNKEWYKHKPTLPYHN